MTLLNVQNKINICARASNISVELKITEARPERLRGKFSKPTSPISSLTV